MGLTATRRQPNHPHFELAFGGISLDWQVSGESSPDPFLLEAVRRVAASRNQARLELLEKVKGGAADNLQTQYKAANEDRTLSMTRAASIAEFQTEEYLQRS